MVFPPLAGVSTADRDGASAPLPRPPFQRLVRAFSRVYSDNVFAEPPVKVVPEKALVKVSPSRPADLLRDQTSWNTMLLKDSSQVSHLNVVIQSRQLSPFVEIGRESDARCERAVLTIDTSCMSDRAWRKVAAITVTDEQATGEHCSSDARPTCAT